MTSSNYIDAETSGELLNIETDAAMNLRGHVEV
jgi:hypothetical protein